MRIGFLASAAVAILAVGTAMGAEPEKSAVELRSDMLVTGLPLSECEKGVYQIRLTGNVDKKGEGSGVLELDPNTPTFDELGFQTVGSSLPVVKLDCSIKVVKRKKFMMPESPRIAAPLVEVEWVIYAIEGPKITSKLFLTMEVNVWSWSRLLVHDKEGKVQYVVGLRQPPPPPPCHPGCFPAGTAIRTLDGTRPVESIHEGDIVATVNADGSASSHKVLSVFTTKNRLIEVRTEAGNLVTTQTQPLALADGGIRVAGELKVGERIWRWDGHERKAVTVNSVSSTGREEPVFNVVLGDSVIFVANDFLARSKPPAQRE
jgi:hypothetical protein